MEKTVKSRPPIVTVLGHVDHGKCVSPRTLVPLSDGRILTAQYLYEELARQGKVKKKDDGWIVFPGKTRKLFGFNHKKISAQPIVAGWKLPSPRYIREITLVSGDRITTTPEHPYFVFTPRGKIVEKRADNLSSGDYVLVPKNLHFSSSLPLLKKSLITKLRNSKNWIVFLDKNKGKRLLEEIKSFGHQKLLKVGLITARFDKASQGKMRLRLKDFFNLVDYFNLPLLDAYAMVDYIKNTTTKWRAGHTSNKIRLPQNSSDFKKLGYVIGCLIGDGYIPEAVLDNNDREVQKIYSSYIKEIFEIETKVERGHTCERVVTTGGKTLTRFLIDIIGLPISNKSATVCIPPILQVYQPMIKHLIEGWLDTDGYVSPLNYSIEFTSKSEILVRQIGTYLLGYGIHSSVYIKNGFWYLRIANKPYLSLFAKNFHPRLKRRSQRIINAVTKSSTNRIFDTMPLSGNFIRDIAYYDKKLPYFSRYKEYENLSRPFVRKLLGLGLIGSDAEFRAVVNTDVSPVQVKRSREVCTKDKWVYDFTIDSIHNFVANRIFVHNTTLLDTIRKTNVASKEAGGITQSIGASTVAAKSGRKITFIDTPGHAAFTKMRSRGANVADIAILVVDASDGVKPQTLEALRVIKEAEIPFIVAATKMDLPSASVETVKSQLEKEGVLFEGRGGDTPTVSVSAKTQTGIDELLEMIGLMAEVHGIEAGDRSEPLEGVVIETSKDRRGLLANIIVRKGVLKTGDLIHTEDVSCKVKALFGDKRMSVKEVLPGEAASVLGFAELPPVGSQVCSGVCEEKEKVPKESFKIGKIKKGQVPIVLKAKNAGSLEAILASLPQNVVVIASGVGEVNESDVLLAKAEGACIVAFDSPVSGDVTRLAEGEEVTIKESGIIYELIGKLDELVKKGEVEILGKAEIVAEFPFNDKRVAGCRVVSGRVGKTDNLVLMRGESEVGKVKGISMKRQKTEISLALAGEEFGILFEPQLDFKIGDVLVSLAK